MELLVKKLHPDAKRPQRMSVGAVGYDLFAYIKQAQGKESRAILPPHNTRPIGTGICCQIKSNNVPFYIQVVSRGSLAKRGIMVANSPGIVDPDYTGEIMVLLINSSYETQYVSHGDRIAQLLITSLATIRESEIREVIDFTPTARGEGRFGSTGP